MRLRAPELGDEPQYPSSLHRGGVAGPELPRDQDHGLRQGTVRPDPEHPLDDALAYVADVVGPVAQIAVVRGRENRRHPLHLLGDGRLGVDVVVSDGVEDGIEHRLVLEDHRVHEEDVRLVLAEFPSHLLGVAKEFLLDQRDGIMKPRELALHLGSVDRAHLDLVEDVAVDECRGDRDAG